MLHLLLYVSPATQKKFLRHRGCEQTDLCDTNYSAILFIVRDRTGLRYRRVVVLLLYRSLRTYSHSLRTGELYIYFMKISQWKINKRSVHEYVDTYVVTYAQYIWIEKSVELTNSTTMYVCRLCTLVVVWFWFCSRTCRDDGSYAALAITYEKLHPNLT